ncbi:unnamed protein product [Durusdinium trenchii]|uniref:Uncharacterized protein n=1 Tax=Durusdinium trenchii TaxID=1381693 RepID=A0ABP0J371_9DINO
MGRTEAAAGWIWAKTTIRESTTGAKMIAQVIRWCKTTSQDQKIIHGILLTSNYMTTIALFLHTLKFKGWLGPRQATVAYEGAYIITGIFYWQFLGTIAQNLDLALLCFIGLVLNFGPRPLWHMYQALMLCYLCSARALLESPVTSLSSIFSLPKMLQELLA